MAQPSLTRAIKLLEDELGGPLFHRERANTHLSELGRMVKPHLEEVWARTQETKRLAEGVRKLLHEEAQARRHVHHRARPLVDLLVNLQMRHPQVEIDIVDSSARDLHERLLAGELEVAIYCDTGKLGDERLHQLPSSASR